MPITMEKEQLTFASKTENIVLVENLIDAVCESFRINEDNYGNILVALTEAVNNAIMHGNKSNPDKKINVTFESKENKLQFTVTDEGEGFDYLNVPDPTDPINIEKPHGRGIFLMKHLADQVEFEDRGRKVKIHFSVSAN